MTAPAPSSHCWTCANHHCREIQRRSCDLKTAGCGEWEEDRTGEIIRDKERGEGMSRQYKEHELKTDPKVFGPVLSGRKTYEIRFADRKFRVHDTLFLRETKYSGKEMKEGKPLIYTGREVRRHVTHILRGPVYGLEKGWVILSIQ